jgi:hypothetical protein
LDFPKNNHVTTGRGGAENPEQNVDHHRCPWRRRGYAAHLFATGARLELLGGSSDPLEQRIRIHAAVAVVALLISLWGWL